MTRQSWVESNNAISIVRQCDLLHVTRSTTYSHWKPVDLNEVDLWDSESYEDMDDQSMFYQAA